MTKEEIQQEVLSVLHRCVLSGSRRHIRMDEPLGEQGLGLDSLALVEFVAALESRFSVEIPDTIWTDRGDLSPKDFVDLLFQLQPQSLSPIKGDRSQVRLDDAANVSYIRKCVATIRQRGVPSGIAWIGSRMILSLFGNIYSQESHVILMRDFSDGAIEIEDSSSPIVFKEFFLNDAPALKEFWPPHRQTAMMKLFRQRVQAGFICLSAWIGEEIVGIDFLSGTGDTDPDTGLKIITAPGTCYALDLYEKYHGRGIGFALLGFSLREAQQRGFQRQVAFVRKNNDKMLAASVQLHGFKKIGEINTTRIFRKPASSWHVNGLTGKEGIIHLVVLFFIHFFYQYFHCLFS